MPNSVIQQQFGAHAANYVTSSVHANGASLARVVELVAPQPTWHALDIATGAGHMALAFAPHVATVIASDVTPEMLTQTALLATSRSIANIKTAIADAEALPFAATNFDLVTCRIAPHHFGNIPRFIDEVFRVLKPGGAFALVDNIAPDDSTTPGHSTIALAAADVAYNVLEKIRDPSHGRALTAAAWRGLLARTKFTVLHQEIMLKAMTFADWCRTQAVPADRVAALESILQTTDATLREFLQPQSRDGGDISFMLREIVLIAQKP